MIERKVSDILTADSLHPIVKWGEEVSVSGWVRTIRESKNVIFIVLYDGSKFESLQVVVDKGLGIDLGRVTSGASLKVVGKPVESKGVGQSIDFQAITVDVIGKAGEEYPIQPKKHSMEFFREHGHLRMRTQLFQAIFRIRHRLAMATHEFFDARDFLYVHTPIISGSDCEGAGEMFRVTTLPIQYEPKVKEFIQHLMKFKDRDTGEIFEKPNFFEYEKIYDHSEDFFGKESGLTVSGQLEAETAALGLGAVYTFGPTFRAENSNTARHLAEFWMIEPEIPFADLKQDMSVAEDFLRAVIQSVYEKCRAELEYLQKYIEEDEKNIKAELRSEPLLKKLERVMCDKFERISYSEAFEILKSSKANQKDKFEFPVEVWGMNFQAEHERYLVEQHFKKPVIVYDYPKGIKAFYMRDNEDGKTVAAMDILFPGIGEIVGGSQREERFDVLKEKMLTFGISQEEMKWYLDTRQFGTAPHSGFGVGFERLVQFVTGMKNIRDVVLYPRTPGNL